MTDLVERHNGIEQDPEGAYVMFEDFKRLQAEDERLEDLLSQCWATCCDSLTTTHVRIQEIASILREKPAALKEQT